jgi:hypothetical protein
VGELWKPWGARRVDGVPSVGMFVADEHVVWYVVEVVELCHEPAWPGARSHEVVLESRTGRAARRRLATSAYSAWWVYPGRFPVCSCCGGPPPCAAQLLDDAVEAEIVRMRRYEISGACPACGRYAGVARQTVTFPDNITVPMGPPVTFHVDTMMCRTAAVEYQRVWLTVHSGAAPLLESSLD